MKFWKRIEAVDWASQGKCLCDFCRKDLKEMRQLVMLTTEGKHASKREQPSLSRACLACSKNTKEQCPGAEKIKEEE